VRVYDANLRNDLVVLQESLDLRQAGLVPRLDVLRRRAIQAAGEEALIQALANRNDIRLRIERAFFNYEASLAKLSSARRGVAAALEAFRDVRLCYASGLSSEVDASVTQDQLIDSLVRRLNATVDVNTTYAQLLRELLPVPRDPQQPLQLQLQWLSSSTGESGSGALP